MLHPEGAIPTEPRVTQKQHTEETEPRRNAVKGQTSKQAMLMPVGSEVPWRQWARSQEPGRKGSQLPPHPHQPASPSGSVSIHQTSQPEELIPLFNPLDNPHLHFHDGSAVKNLPAMQEMFNPWVGEIPCRRE